MDHQRWSKEKFKGAALKTAKGKAICVWVNKGVSIEEQKDGGQTEQGHSGGWPNGLPKFIEL